MNIFDERPAGHSSRLPQVSHAVDMVEFRVRLHILEKIVIFLIFFLNGMAFNMSFSFLCVNKSSEF